MKQDRFFEDHLICVSDDPGNDFNTGIGSDELYNDAYREFTKTLNNAYAVLRLSFPMVEKPSIYVGSSSSCNAEVNNRKEIIISTGLIDTAVDAINIRYSDARLSKAGLLSHLHGAQIRSEIQYYVWRFIVLHEAYHLWHGHLEWDQNYSFNEDGKINRCIVNSLETLTQEKSYQERILYFECGSEDDRQKAITNQAKELDADLSAIQMLFLQMTAPIQKEKNCLKLMEHTTLLLGALLTIFSILDGNDGAQFEKLIDPRFYMSDHPLPAIRMYYAEEQLNWLLFELLGDTNIFLINKIESEWLIIVDDLESMRTQDTDWRNVFHYPAYTAAAQQRTTQLKKRFNEMYDTMSEFATGGMLEKL